MDSDGRSKYRLQRWHFAEFTTAALEQVQA